MKTKSVLIIVTSIIFFTTSSCDKLGLAGPEGPEGPALTGSVIGFVTLRDEYGVLLADNSGVYVSVEGSQPALTTLTTSSGRYQFDNLQVGTYDLVFSKTGFGTMKNLGFIFVGGDKPRIFNTTMSQISTSMLNNLSLTSTSSTVFSASGTISPAVISSSYKLIRFFYSKSNTVSSTNYLTSYVTTNTTTTAFSSSRSFDKVTYPSGTTMYVKAYSDISSSYGYMDIITGSTINSTMNQTGSNVASIVVP